MDLEPRRVTTERCPHAHTTSQTLKTPFFNKTFEAEASVCLDCGQTLWTTATQSHFQTWVADLKNQRRNSFQVQFYLPKGAHSGLEALLTRFPSVPKSALMRAVTSLYLSVRARRPEFDQISRELVELGSYRLVSSGPRRKTSLQFSPMALLELQAWTSRLNRPAYKIVEEAIYKILALSVEPSPKLHELWEDDLKPQLELILRSL